MIAELDRETGDRRDDPLLEIGHVVEDGGRLEPGIVGGPTIRFDLASDELRRDGDRPARGWLDLERRAERRVVVDPVEPEGTQDE